MLYGADIGELELRAARDGSARLSGRFPYNSTAVLSDGGRTGKPRKERIASRAFAYRVEDATKEIHLLVGHDFGMPLASKLTGSLNLRDADDALSFEADIPSDIADTSYGKDILAQVRSGLAYGVSPGFRLPPARRVRQAETVEEEEVDPPAGKFGALIRTVWDALLYEISIVTRPAYKESQIEARSWDLTQDLTKDLPDDTLRHALNRWRA